jgi:TPP-dependent indolepyruvate ferredoxin oxidoreductase alpha subunit
MSELEKVFAKPDLLLRSEHSLCPGCGEPVALRIILELIAELAVRERTICVAGIGCYTAFPPVMDVDVMQALHGRAPSVATGVKRVRPDAVVFTMQGDGDMISEGLQEVLHAAARGEKITAIVFNNAVFGETGGHMTAATVLGQHTKTTVGGRDRERQHKRQGGIEKRQGIARSIPARRPFILGVDKEGNTAHFAARTSHTPGRRSRIVATAGRRLTVNVRTIVHSLAPHAVDCIHASY